MRHNADENEGDLPLRVKAVYNHFYMDDGLPSTDSREEAIEMLKQRTELLLHGCFHLHKCLTDDPEVLATIPVEDRYPRFLELSEDKLTTDRAMVATWDAQDVFRFNALKQEPAATKRTILSQAFSVWYPRGPLLTFSIQSKIILQNLNRFKYWRYVPTGDNPAYDITRALHPVELNVKHRSSAGPEFLYKPAEFWPENKVKEDKREMKSLRWVRGSQESEPVLGWKRYSSLAKIRRVLAYVMRFARNTPRVKRNCSRRDR